MEVLRRSSVFAAEIMDAFDRSPTDKELVAQAKALGREYVHARLLRAGLSWSAPERAAPFPGRLAEVCAVLLRLGDELEMIRPSVYRNVARQLHISLQSEPVVTDAFLAVAGHIFSAGMPSLPIPWDLREGSGVCGSVLQGPHEPAPAHPGAAQCSLVLSRCCRCLELPSDQCGSSGLKLQHSGSLVVLWVGGHAGQLAQAS
uniref:BCL2 family apoptosis regulator BOK n=1 Tax=Callithrix jacchus TaxID=9483 RepID=A0A5F4WFD6_CALJA